MYYMKNRNNISDEEDKMLKVKGSYLAMKVQYLTYFLGGIHFSMNNDNYWFLYDIAWTPW